MGFYTTFRSHIFRKFFTYDCLEVWRKKYVSINSYHFQFITRKLFLDETLYVQLIFLKHLFVNIVMFLIHFKKKTHKVS